MLIKSVILTLVFLVSSLSTSNITSTYFITVEVTLKKAEGDVYLALYNKSEHFPKKGDEHIYKGTVINVVDKKVTYTFKELPKGEYAVATYHDRNSNGQFDFNFIGWPLEGYGFSTNYKPRFSAPDFEDVSFNLEDNTLVEIKMLN